MKKLLPILISSAMICSFTASAASVGSIDISVTGRIDPAACELDIAGGGNIDYGLIDLDTLTFVDGAFGGKFAALPIQETSFTIRCSANAPVKLSASSKRVGTVAGATENSRGFAALPIKLLDIGAGNSSNGVAGLGKTSTGINIGGYIVRYKANSLNVSTLDSNNQLTTISGSEVQNIYYNTQSKVWKVSGGNLFSNNMDLQTSFAKANETTPIEASIYDGVLQVQAYVSEEAATVGKSKPVLLDGLSTIELNYI
ncbi:DUF1120 domain-containing protein [Providencia rettgeri]|uniref:DUF1120 domain-containing protein n=3 Tax=Providencia TaxID=586 RepID=A0AA42FLA4_9GAMM|nr:MULTISPECIES: DUF1120 domain-containing protein [Providencia]HCI96739.1 DUF1120 domain-containing protein [Providencia sp.]EJD6083625.1 DUF1120 domain-containing protein [Providencia rettgeri]EJD6370617.1 DUF1120 domain-containing protein [Providencia rettgeri]EJD6399624.1 DUF1120 domain-containing protein [Providencia rettgeri]EJD6409623.1 DUF1120 domain-containing protein [Providencia rettgeri]